MQRGNPARRSPSQEDQRIAQSSPIVEPDETARDRDFHDRLFRDHHDWLVRRLTLVVRDIDEAQDLAQMTFLRALEHWPIRSDRDPRPWLATVGIRLAIDERRRRRRWGFLPVRETDATWTLRVDPDLWTALGGLDRRTRAALVLTVLEGHTQDEVAEAMGVPRGTVASWLSRGRDRLRPLLEVIDR